MAGYTRQDIANNIANGNVIDADDFDAEYNAIEGAFNNTSGHTHDGTSGEGAPITKVGPVQDLIISGTAVMPKSTNTLDLGSASVQYKDAYFDGTVNTDTLTVDGTATIASTLGVTGVTTLGNNLDVAGAAGVGGDFDVNTTKFTVNATTGNTAVAGTLGVTGATTLSSTLNVTGTTNLGGALNVTGNAGIDGNFDVATNKFTVDSQSGNTNVAGVLAVTGNINGSSGLNVTGNAGIDGNFDVNTNKFTVSSTTGNTAVAGTLSAAGNTTVGGTLGVTGATTLSNTLGVTGNTTVGGTLAVTGASTLTGAVSAPAGVTGNVIGNLTGNVTGNVTGNLTGNVASTGANSMASLTTTGDVVVGGNLTVSGTTTTVNTETINLADNQILLNSNYTGSTPTENGGIEIERGTLANKTLVWDETADKWTVGSETFVAGTFEGNLTGAVTGNASTATKLATARTIGLSGDVTGSVSFDGSANATITATVVDDSHTHDGRYYTESESDSLFTASAGDVMTGNLRFNDNVKANFGTDTDFEIYSNNLNALIDMNTGISNLLIRDVSTTRFTFNRSTGDFTASGNVTAYSDERLKSDIVTIPDALEKVKALRGVNFTKDGEASTGVIAQEVQKVIPEVVQQNDEYLSVAYGNLVGVLIEAVKELSAEVEALKAK